MPKILLIITLMLCTSLLRGQSASPWVVNSSGGEGTTSGISITWSVGELMTETFYAQETILTQGLLQPQITVSTMVENVAAEDLQIKVYPNPAREHLNISLAEFSGRKLNYALYDMGGNLVKSAAIHNTMETFAVNNLTPSIYFLHILEAGRIIKVFKIVKQ